MLARIDRPRLRRRPPRALAGPTGRRATTRTRGRRQIIAAVRAGGDAALRALHGAVRRLRIDELARPDRPSRRPRSTRLDPDLRAALEFARDQIVAWHEAQREKEARPRTLRRRASASSSFPSTGPAATCPGGRAPLASSVLMTALPARVAGVGRSRRVLAAAAPTGPSHDAILAAAALAGVDEVYRVGGAQAIAALAYGTEIDPPRST